MEPPKLGTNPVVESAHENASVIRVRAVVLQRAGIAGASGSFIEGSSVVRTRRQRKKPVPHRTLPVVQFTKVDESGVLIWLASEAGDPILPAAMHLRLLSQPCSRCNRSRK